jgi:hypothetical protein
VDIVINAHNGHFVRHAKTGPAAGVEYLLASVIVAGHDADRFRETFEPFSDGLLFCFPIQPPCFGFNA